MTAAKFREIALSLPEATEVWVESWGESTFRLRGKMFATLAGTMASIKASLEDQEELVKSHPDIFFVPHYSGHYGWVGVKLPKASARAVRELLVRAWRRTAPKRLAASVEDSNVQSSRGPNRSANARARQGSSRAAKEADEL